MKSRVQEPQNWREGRRWRAWDLKQAGWKQCTIAAALGVSEGAVSQWLKRGRAYGVDALRRRPPRGAVPRLTAEQRARIPGLLARGAEAFGFRGAVWTTPRIATVIDQEFGVRYHPAHVSRLLRAVGWSPQRPLQRASQRDEAAIQAWSTDRWPAIKKKPRRRAARSSG